MFDSLNYVLGPFLYCCWSLVPFWASFVAFRWRFLGWRRRLQCIVIMQSFLRLLKLRKLAVRKLDLMRGGLTRCHGVLDHELNLHRNIPLTVHVNFPGLSSTNLKICSFYLCSTLNSFSFPDCWLDETKHQITSSWAQGTFQNAVSYIWEAKTIKSSSKM